MNDYVCDAHRPALFCLTCTRQFVCPTEILAFNDRAEEFRQLNAEVVVASTDSHFSHHAWANTSRKEGLTYPPTHSLFFFFFFTFLIVLQDKICSNLASSPLSTIWFIIVILLSLFSDVCMCCQL